MINNSHHTTRLRTELERRVADLVSRTGTPGMRVPQDELEEVIRLRQLAEVYEHTRSKTTRARRWAVIIPVIITVATLSFLAFARVGVTHIEMEVSVTGFEFTMPERDVVVDQLKPRMLRISGLRQVEFPRSQQQEERTLASSSMVLGVSAAESRRGQINVSGMTAASGTRLSLRAAESDDEYRLTLSPRREEVTVSVDGPLEVITDDTDAVVDFAVPRQIRMRPAGQEIVLEFVVDSTHPMLSYQMQANDLSFGRLDQFRDGEESLLRDVSTIRSGTIYMDALNGEARPLRAGESLRFRSTSGIVRELQLNRGGILVRYSGDVEDMSTGSATYARSMMPTYLEWLRARRPLWLIWGITVYVIGMIAGTMQWWRAKS